MLVLFIKYPSFTSVKKVTPLPKSIIYYNCVFLSCEILCWMVLSMSSIQHQHPFPTFMKIFFKYTHTKCMKATQRPYYHHTLHAGIFFMWIFVCFWTWHSICNYTHACFVTCGTLKIGMNQHTSCSPDSWYRFFICYSLYFLNFIIDMLRRAAIFFEVWIRPLKNYMEIR